MCVEVNGDKEEHLHDEKTGDNLDNELDRYVALCDIDDEKEEEAPRFTLVFSTPKNLSKLTSDKVLQTDATFCLNWNGFPVFVVGNEKFIHLKISWA